jgi:serine/threonine-protein kinase
MDAGRSVTATFTKAVAVCVVPKLKGKTLAAARRALKSAHCSAGKVTRSYSAHVRKGRVSSQSPRAGRKLAAAAKVRFTLSKGKRP